MNILKGITKLDRRRITKTPATPTNKVGGNNLKKELNAWLDNRTVWNHDDWLSLLSDLRTKGYSDLIDTPKGQDAIGLYLETNRRFPSC